MCVHSLYTYPVERGGLQHSSGAAHFPDGVHAELRGANVHRSHGQVGRHHGPDGGATAAVIAHHHLLWSSSIAMLCITGQH